MKAIVSSKSLAKALSNIDKDEVLLIDTHGSKDSICINTESNSIPISCAVISTGYVDLGTTKAKQLRNLLFSISERPVTISGIGYDLSVTVHF